MRPEGSGTGGSPGAGADSGDDLYVIQNPVAGKGRPDRLRHRIETALAARGVGYGYAVTEGPGHAEELARGAVLAGYGRVAVAGGDGTVLEVVSALVGRDVALGLIPVGTGNQLAANLGIPRRLGRAIETVIGGSVRTIDVGTVDGRPFTCIAGAGFDAEVVRPDSRVKRWLGYLAYVQAAVSAVFAPRGAALRVVVDGRESRFTGMGVEITNMPGLTAPGLLRPVRLVPDGRADDGLLDVCVFATETTFGFLAMLTSIVARRHTRDPRLRYFRGREIVIDARPPLPVQIDGERFGTTPLTARVQPAALRVLVPSA